MRCHFFHTNCPAAMPGASGYIYTYIYISLDSLCKLFSQESSTRYADGNVKNLFSSKDPKVVTKNASCRFFFCFSFGELENSGEHISYDVSTTSEPDVFVCLSQGSQSTSFHRVVTMDSCKLTKENQLQYVSFHIALLCFSLAGVLWRVCCARSGLQSWRMSWA